MDDKDQDQAATDTGIGTAGSTLGGAAAGAVAGTALNETKSIDQDENEAGYRPQSYQEVGQKAGAESPRNLCRTPDCI